MLVRALGMVDLRKPIGCIGYVAWMIALLLAHFVVQIALDPHVVGWGRFVGASQLREAYQWLLILVMVMVVARRGQSIGLSWWLSLLLYFGVMQGCLALVRTFELPMLADVVLVSVAYAPVYVFAFLPTRLFEMIRFRA